MKFKEVPTAFGPIDSMDDIKKMGKHGEVAKDLYKKSKEQAAKGLYDKLDWAAFSLSWGDELLEHAQNKTFLNKLEDFVKGFKTASVEDLKKRREGDESTLKDLLGKLGEDRPLPKTPEERQALYQDIKRRKRELTDQFFKKLKPKLKGPDKENEYGSRMEMSI